MNVDLERIVKQYKFCFKCGGVLELKEKNLLVCKSCGFHYYINPVTANGAVLENEQGEILLVVRGKDPKKDFYDVPGGFVDLNENVEESMERELKEELGFIPSGLKYNMSYPDEYLYDGVLFPTLIFLFTGKIGSQEIKPQDDISGYKFFAPNEIPFEKLAFEGLKIALKKYVTSRR